MINKNITHLTIIITLLIASYLLAPLKYSWRPDTGSTQVGFQLQNFSNYLIQFQIDNESAGPYHRHIFEIEPNGEYGIKINTNVQTTLKIYYCPETSNLCSESELPKANIVQATFPLGKTIYISWDGKELLPQTEGPIHQTTRAGYYLTDNVQPRDYALVHKEMAHNVYPKERNRSPWEIFPQAQEYAKTLRPNEVLTDGTLAKLVLGLGGTPTDNQINQAWAAISAQWNPDDHPDEPNFARAVMRIINRSWNNLFNSVIKTGQ